mmetsp:Transcript_111666/g.280935  ORF Transcript_111666/g.280935 Transcript_111666/m.280935 type:complete len:106 (-) Transcript_111666:19-336(-)
MPVSTSIAPGFWALEVFLLRVVSTMVSFEPVFLTLRSKAFPPVRPLNFLELRPQRLPGSADITGMLRLLRMKELLPLTHSQMRSAAAAAGMLTERRMRGQGRVRV